MPTFAFGKVLHDQLPLNSPRAGRQQGSEVVAVRCKELSLFFTTFLHGQPEFQHLFLQEKCPTTISGNIKVISLPSTSPANARLSFERKLEYWKALLFQKCEEDGKDETEG